MCNNWTIRPETPADWRKAEELTREAFWDRYTPGSDEHYLIHQMRSHKDFVPQLTLVAEEDGELVGHIAYTQTYILQADGQKRPVLCFGPISVRPDHQNQGVGRGLIETSFALAREMGHTAVCIMGDPRYYGRMGFRWGERYDITTADGYFSSALLAAELVPGALANAAGRFFESPLFETFMDDGFAEYDATFPPREEGWNQSQEDFKFMGALQYKPE